MSHRKGSFDHTRHSRDNRNKKTGNHVKAQLAEGNDEKD